ncbi:MAG: hypothetical protein IPF99_09305 [Deltaproteobacteria bacterium]|nr:hypothetical protein [Deltaproteobacteria bacterium]
MRLHLPLHLGEVFGPARRRQEAIDHRAELIGDHQRAQGPAKHVGVGAQQHE